MHLVPNITVDGLPPARAELVRYQDTLAQLATDLDLLVSGRRMLADQIESAEVAKARADDAVKAAGRSVVDKIRKGVDWSIAAVTARREPVAPAPDLSVARAAIIEIDAEIAAKRSEVDALKAREPALIAAALGEAAEGIVADYNAAIETARECIARLEGLDIACGGGRMGRPVGELPAFGICGHDGETVQVAVAPADIRDAVGVWRGLAAAIARDPRAPAEKYRQFATLREDSAEGLSYHELTAAEMAAVDRRYTSN